jgi:uncharacterized protein HemX
MISRHVAQVLMAAIVLVPLWWASPPAAGQQVYIYPNQGQSAQQQSRDRYECHSWAVQQTGVDPTAPQMAQTTPPPGAPQGQVLRGAAGGAALGAVGGAIAGDAGQGAAIGAATGGLFGGMKRRSHARQEEQAVAQQQAATGQQHAAYERALSACLAGRGYTVR